MKFPSIDDFTYKTEISGFVVVFGTKSLNAINQTVIVAAATIAATTPKTTEAATLALVTECAALQPSVSHTENRLEPRQYVPTSDRWKFLLKWSVLKGAHPRTVIQLPPTGNERSSAHQ
jgi:hypothetical protein